MNSAKAAWAQPSRAAWWFCVLQEGQQLSCWQDSELEAPLGLVGDGAGDGQGGGGGGRRSVPDVQDPAAHGPCASIEHKVIHQVPLSVQSLGSHTRGAPAKQGGAQHEENVILSQEFIL